jgi:hypothetical protein
VQPFRYPDDGCTLYAGHSILRRGFVAFLFLALARVSIFADAINLPIVLGYGAAVLIPLLVFQTVVETLILKPFIGWKFRDGSGPVLRANIWSVVAGIPTKFLNLWIYESILPKNFYDYFRLYVCAVAVGSCVYYAVTVAVEWWVLRRRLPEPGGRLGKMRLLAAVALANLVTYSVCAPLFYQATKPWHDIAEVTPDSRWTRNPGQQILYVDSQTKFLRMIRANGEEDRLLVPFAMRDYILDEHLQQCLFRSEEEKAKYYHFDRRTGKRREIESARGLVNLNVGSMAFNPSGRHVAFLKESAVILEALETHKARSLFTIDSHRWDLALNWTTNEFALLAETGTNRVALFFEKEAVEWEPRTRDQVSLFPKIGRVIGEDDRNVAISSDGEIRSLRAETTNWTAFVERGLGSSVRIHNKRGGKVLVADNPGWLHLGNRWFGDVVFLSDNECLFDDHDSIYIIDLAARKLGRVARGQRFSLLQAPVERGSVALK